MVGQRFGERTGSNNGVTPVSERLTRKRMLLDSEKSW